MILKTVIKNFKIIEDFTGEFSSGNLYLVVGRNGTGKTTFLQTVNMVLTGKLKKNSVTKGKEVGELKAEIIDYKGKDGNNYKIAMDFTNNEMKIKLVTPDGDIKKKVSDIQELFKFNTFTIDEFVAWGAYAEGRKKQANIIKQMLPELKQKLLAELEEKISEKGKDNLYAKRTAINKTIDFNKTTLEKIVFNEEQIKLLASAKLADGSYQKDTNDLKKQVDDLQKVIDSKATNLALKQTKQDLIKSNEEEIVKKNASIKEYQEKIQILLNEIDEKKKENIKITGEIANIEVGGEDIVKQHAELSAKWLTRNQYVLSYDELKKKEKEQFDLRKELADAMNQAELKTKEIDDIRKEKKDILATIKIPNITIEDDELFYVDGEEKYPFSLDYISYSIAGIIGTQIILEVNKDLPIVLLGYSAEYDKNSLNKIAELASKYGAIIYADKVVDTEEQTLEVQIYE